MWPAACQRSALLKTLCSFYTTYPAASLLDPAFLRGHEVVVEVIERPRIHHHNLLLVAGKDEQWGAAEGAEMATLVASRARAFELEHRKLVLALSHIKARTSEKTVCLEGGSCGSLTISTVAQVSQGGWTLDLILDCFAQTAAILEPI